MAQSLSKILLHVVFSTKDRRPFLRDRTLREEMHRYLGGILHELNCPSVIVGGVQDHVHILCVLSRTCAPSDMVKEVKRGSSGVHLDTVLKVGGEAVPHRQKAMVHSGDKA